MGDKNLLMIVVLLGLATIPISVGLGYFWGKSKNGMVNQWGGGCPGDFFGPMLIGNSVMACAAVMFAIQLFVKGEIPRGMDPGLDCVSLLGGIPYGIFIILLSFFAYDRGEKKRK